MTKVMSKIRNYVSQHTHLTLSNIEGNANSEDPIEMGSSVVYAGGKDYSLIVSVSKQSVTTQQQHRYAVSGVG